MYIDVGIEATECAHREGHFVECGLQNAESCQGVICAKFDADFLLQNEG